MLVVPLRSLGRWIGQAQRATAAGERIFEVLDEPEGVDDRPGAGALPDGPGEIRFEGVSFAYLPGRPVLEAIHLEMDAGSTVALVNCGDGLEVDISVPEGLIGGIEEGMPATLRFDALPEEVLAGTVTEVGVAARAGATFPVTVRIDGDHPGLRSGLAAEATLEFGGEGGQEVILVPLTAVVHEPDGSFVFLAEPDGAEQATVARRQVQLGELTAEGLEIKGGLTPGDLVITAGTSVIREGLRVRLERGQRSVES
jgi:multidrug efflux pump subunit AcrA (membrane-fusion protein)